MEINKDNPEIVKISNDQSDPVNTSFDTNPDFQKTIIDKLLRGNKQNSGAPTFTPRGFQEQFYFQDDGSLWFYNGGWVKVGASNYKVGDFTESADGDHAVTGLGFTPKFVRIKGYYPQDDSSMSDGSAGAADNQHVMYFYNAAASGTDPNYVYGFSGTKIVYLPNREGTKYLEGVLKSFDSDGFTITFSTFNTPGTCQLAWEAFG